MPDSVADRSQILGIFHSLGIAAFETIGRTGLRLVGPEPAWLGRALPRGDSPQDALVVENVFPFLCSFLPDAEEFWARPEADRLTSEIWTQTDRAGNALPLQASAVISGGMPLLLIQLVAEEYEWRRQDSQRSRERALRLDYFDRETDEKFFDVSQRIASLVRNSPLAVVEFDVDLRVTGWNAAAERMFGWRADEVMGKKLGDWRFVHEDDRAGVSHVFRTLSESGSLASTNRNYRKDGAIIYCEWYNSARFDKRGRLASAMAMALDVTARRTAEIALRASEEKFRSIFESAPVGVFRSNAAGRLLNVNNRMAGMFGFESAAAMTAAVGSTLEQLYVDPARRHQMLGRALKSTTFVQETLEGRRRDGSIFTTNLFLRVLEDRHGDFFRLEGFVEDITARLAAERELQRAHDELEQRVLERTEELSQANERLQELDRLKSRFLASISHELRTPLNSIIGFSSLMRERLSGPINDQQEKQLDIVVRSSRHLLGLINELLDLSRIEAGRADLQYETFDVVEVIREAVASLQPLAASKHLDLLQRSEPAAIEIHADRKRSYQVVLNLLNNAIKFTETGCVRIASAIRADQVEISVTDTGIGIRQEDLTTLFEAFRQVDSSTGRRHEGTGLGLYLCRKLLDLMGGAIRAESEFGRGSRFVVTLPLQQTPVLVPDSELAGRSS